jgi:uncharacterized protein (TIGR02996 family)
MTRLLESLRKLNCVISRRLSRPYIVTADNQELAFLTAIEAEPQDKVHRLVFADWLEEHAEESVLRDCVIAFHRDWVRLRRLPALRTRRVSRDRWLWMQSRFTVDIGLTTSDILYPDLFRFLEAGALWSSSRATRRAYTSQQRAEEDLRLAYLRRAGLLLPAKP